MQLDTDTVAWRNQVEGEGRRILRYWRDHVLLPGGGFYGRVTADGKADQAAPRSLVLATRILWTYARAITSGYADTEEYRVTADQAYAFLRKYYWDSEHLGFYWMIDGANHPIQLGKHIYGQAFAIYALAEYHAASGNEEALQLALQTQWIVEHKAADHVHGGYHEDFTREWERGNVVGHHAVNQGWPKSMNTHLHILEAYTRLYQVKHDAALGHRLFDVLEVVLQRIVHSDSGHFRLFFTSDWQVRGDVVSYGHDIEGSWLMLEAAEALGDEQLIEACSQLAVRMVDAVMLEGVDADHGVMNEGRGTQSLDHEVHWWQQAEGVVGCLNAYQITGNLRYLQEAKAMWAFIEQYLLDTRQFEWLPIAKRHVPKSAVAVVDSWKCPYHNTRACMEVYKRIALLEREVS